MLLAVETMYDTSKITKSSCRLQLTSTAPSCVSHFSPPNSIQPCVALSDGELSCGPLDTNLISFDLTSDSALVESSLTELSILSS